jgi:hypothetical protein
MSQTLRNYLSVIGTTAGGALIAYLSSALANGVPGSPTAWRTLGTGALVAVVASLIHLYQSPPGKVSVPLTTGDVK